MKSELLPIPIYGGNTSFLRGSHCDDGFAHYKHKEMPSSALLIYSTSHALSFFCEDYLLAKGNIAVKRNQDLSWASVEEIEGLNVFNVDVIAYLRGLSEFTYNHQDVGSHLRHFIEQEVRMDPSSFETVDGDLLKLKRDLSYLVFTEDFAEKAVESIEGRAEVKLFTNAWYWVLFFLENLNRGLSEQGVVPFWDNPRTINIGQLFCTLNIVTMQDFEVNYLDGDELCDNGDRYKHHREGDTNWSTSIDQWFVHSFHNGRNPTGLRDINIINIGNMSLENADFPSNPSTQFFFHGTSWGSVEEIMKGVCLSSEEPLDFSCYGRPGFYVSDSFTRAKEWALKRFKLCPAVVVFNVDASVFNDRDDQSHINVTRERREDIYKFFRKNGEEEGNGNLAEETQRYHSITGPLLCNPCPFRKGEQPAVFERDTLQTCILHKAIADEFTAAINCVVYFRSQPKLRQRQRRP